MPSCGETVGAAGSNWGPLTDTQTHWHFIFCRNLLQSAEAEEQPNQHGVTCQREPCKHGPSTGGAAPVLRGPLSQLGTPGNPWGTPQPWDTPVVSPCLHCHPCPGVVGTSSLDRGQILP